MFKGRIEVRIKAAEIAAQHAQAVHGHMGAQEWLTNAVIRDTDQFVPFDTGQLAGTPRVASDFKTGVIVYNTPYARRLYYGESFNFSRDGHTKATHHWFESAKREYLNYWGQAVAKILGGKWVKK